MMSFVVIVSYSGTQHTTHATHSCRLNVEWMCVGVVDTIRGCIITVQLTKGSGNHIQFLTSPGYRFAVKLSGRISTGPFVCTI